MKCIAHDIRLGASIRASSFNLFELHETFSQIFCTKLCLCLSLNAKLCSGLGLKCKSSVKSKQYRDKETYCDEKVNLASIQIKYCNLYSVGDCYLSIKYCYITKILTMLVSTDLISTLSPLSLFNPSEFMQGNEKLVKLENTKSKLA